MAKLPTRDDLPAMPSARSGRPIASYDTSAIGKGVADLGKGISTIGPALNALEKHNNAVADYETERKFKEFTWNQQLDLEKAGQEMEPGQAGNFAESWATGYKTRAKEFLDTVPPALRGKYDVKAFDAERELYGSASKFGRTEQRRSSVAGLDDFANRTLPRIATPENFEKFRADYEGQIATNPWLSKTEKDALRREKVADLEMQYGQKVLAERKNARGVLRDLGAEPLDTQENPETRAQPFSGVAAGAVPAPAFQIPAAERERLPAGMRNNNPGNIKYTSRLAFAGVTGPSKNTDQGDTQAVFETPQQGMSAAADLARRKYQSGKTSAMELIAGRMGWTPGNDDAARNIARTMGIAPDADLGLDKPENMTRFLKALTLQEHGAASSRYPDALYQRAAGANVTDIQPSAPALTGPYRNLSVDQRLKLAATARTMLKQEAAEVRQDVSDFEKIAEQGFSPKPGQLAALRTRVAEAGDPDVRQSFAQAEAVVQWQDVARKWTPQQLDGEIRAETERLREGGATAFDAKRLTMANKLLDTMRTELKQDALGWAERVGHIQVQPIDFAAPDGGASSVAMRVKQANSVADHYGLEPKYLRPDERQRLAMGLDEGGDRALAVAGAISSAAGDRARDIFAEVSKESPTAAIIGGMVAETGLSAAARDAVEGIKLRKAPGFQSAGGSRQIVRKALTDELGAALSGMPTAENAITDTANAIYEIRARKQNITDFDANIWRQGLREAIGERTINGEKYGGIDDANPGWGQRNIIIPPFIRQDGWRQTIDAIQPGDLEGAGLSVPVGSDGKPVSLNRVKGGTLVQTGNGRYGVNLADPSATGDEVTLLRRKDAPGEPFEIDMYRLRPFLQNRRPELFAGGDELNFQMRRPYDAAQRPAPAAPAIDDPLALSGLGG